MRNHSKKIWKLLKKKTQQVEKSILIFTDNKENPHPQKNKQRTLKAEIIQLESLGFCWMFAVFRSLQFQFSFHFKLPKVLFKFVFLHEHIGMRNENLFLLTSYIRDRRLHLQMNSL